MYAIQRKTNMIQLIRGILKNYTNELIYKTEIDSWIQKTNVCLMGRGGGINWEIGIETYTLLYVKQITNKDPL